MAKNTTTTSAPATHPLLVHPSNQSGGVVTGKDPKGAVVTVQVNTNGKQSWVEVTKGDFTSARFPGYNNQTKKLFDLLCAYEGTPALIAEFANGKVQVVKAAGKVHVSYKGETKSFAPDAATGGISKEARLAINKFIETETPSAKPGKVELQKP